MKRKNCGFKKAQGKTLQCLKLLAFPLVEALSNILKQHYVTTRISPEITASESF